jgi:hypothetical protein
MITEREEKMNQPDVQDRLSTITSKIAFLRDAFGSAKFQFTHFGTTEVSTIPRDISDELQTIAGARVVTEANHGEIGLSDM